MGGIRVPKQARPRRAFPHTHVIWARKNGETTEMDAGQGRWGRRRGGVVGVVVGGTRRRHRRVANVVSGTG